MTGVYVFCLTLGFVFTVGGAILGGLLGGHGHGHDVDAGGGHGPDVSHSYGAGHDVGGGHDLSAGHDVGGEGLGEGDVGDHGSSILSLPILSPTVLSFFVASFGGAGLIFERLFPLPILHLPLALLSAAALGLALAWGLWKFTSTFDSARMARATDALGACAEVSITVPPQGMGEIAYVSGGTRQTLSARSLDGREYKQGSAVRVARLAEGVALVVEAPAIGSVPETPTSDVPRGEPVRVRQRS